MNIRTVSASVTCLAALFLLGCSGETELFEATGQELASQGLGPCSIVPAPLPNEVAIEDSASCGEGACLSYQGQVECSCRCDGRAEYGPFCTCLPGFVCQADVVPDFGLSPPSKDPAGSYCVRPSE